MTQLSPIAEGLWTDEASPRLIAGRRRSDGELVFPLPGGSAGKDYDPVPLPARGVLWSWTSQSFRPKSPPYTGPEAFEPYAVGYVQLGDMLIVEGRLTQLEGLQIGMPMQLELVRFGDVVTYAFGPADAA